MTLLRTGVQISEYDEVKTLTLFLKPLSMGISLLSIA